MLSERAEEILEALWIQNEEQGKRVLDLGASRDEPAIEELLKLGFIRKDLDHIHLLEKGKAQAIACVRRHRLAERLLKDVFQIKKDLMNEVSCRFEHLLHEGLEDKVCTLLGHPKICPHGKPIPQGKCCLGKEEKKIMKLVAPLSQLEPRDKGHIVYLQTRHSSQMQKLISIGAVPGVGLTLLQKFPSFVFKVGQGQFAVDRELAAAIYVRLTK